MRNKINFLVLAMLALLSACTRGNMLPPRTVEVEGSYSVAIPANFKPCNDLHDFATLQYSDERSGYFLLGIEEPKSKIEALKMNYSLADYTEFVENNIGGAFDSMLVLQRDTIVVNGIQCQTTDMYTYVKSEEAPLEVYYHLAVFESENQFYQLIGWTEKSEESDFQLAAQAIDRSFQECSNGNSESQTASAVKLH